MKTATRPIALCFTSCVFSSVLCAGEESPQSGLYFPPATGAWETVLPEDAGWDGALLQKALDYAGENESSGVVILYDGRILAEQYFEIQGRNSARYRQRRLGVDDAGGAIEDVASAQKSVASILVGIAREKGLLSLDDSVSRYLGAGWSQAAPEQERAITIRHLLTMTSGLDDRGRFEAEPGTRWRYNTAVYARSLDVVEAAADMDRHEFTRRWLTEPLGMSHSRWVTRAAPDVQAVNRFGFATTARDLARFGLLILARGRWNDETVLGDQQYLREATSTSQTLNPYYGYLWWVNRNAETGQRSLETAPGDMVSANGALNRRCFIVPSLKLVVTRLGDQPEAGRSFDRRFWELLSDAGPGESHDD